MSTEFGTPSKYGRKPEPARPAQGPHVPRRGPRPAPRTLPTKRR